MYGTRAATAGCGSLARSYRARSQVLVIEELNELAGRHPYDLDKPPIRSEESDPRSLLGKHGLANLRECLPYGDIGEDHDADIREYGELSTLRQAIVRGAFDVLQEHLDHRGSGEGGTIYW
jgi:hypothetical protein